MPPANADKAPLSLRHLLAGLQGGITGGFALLLFSMASCVLSHRSAWLIPNLFATTFYGASAYRTGFVRSTLPGLALFFVVYGLLGILWGAAVREKRWPGLPLWGALYGVVCYYLLFRLGWKHWNPLIPLYSPDGILRLGHLIWGIFLARTPVYSQRILGVNEGANDARSDSGDPAIRTGELIR